MNIKSYTLQGLALLFWVGTIAISACKQDVREPDQNSAENKSLYTKALDAYKARQVDTSEVLLIQALEQARERKDPEEIAKSLYLMASIHKTKKRFEEQEASLLEFLSFPSNITSPKHRVNANSKLANIYQQKGEYDKAFDHLYEGLSFAKSQERPAEIARAYYELGTLHYYREEYEKALENYKNSESHDDGKKTKGVIFSNTAAIGSTYDQLGKHDTALDYNLKSLEIAREMNVPTPLAYALQNIGSTYLKLGRFDESESSLLRALEINDSTDDKMAKLGVLRDLGLLYTELKNYPKALRYLEQGPEIANAINAKSRRLEFYDALSETYIATGDLDKAVMFLQEKTILKDSIINEETEKSIESLKAAYSAEQRENEIALLEQKNKVAQLSIYLFIGISFFSIAFLIFLFRKNREEKRLNQELDHRNNKIELQNMQLEEINQELKQFTSVASHDLKSPLRTVSSFANLFQRKYRGKLDEEANEYLDFIIGGVKRMVSMLDDLLSYAKVGKKDIPFDWVKTSDIVTEALFNLQENIKDEGATVEVSEESLPEIKGNKTLMVQLFQNLIANAIKFRSHQDPKVEVTCSQNGKTHTFMVKDNGIGIDPDYQSKIFEMFGRINGKTEYEGTGIGLATCKKIVNYHGGQIWVESEMGKGSTFYFSVPKTSPEAVASSN